MAQQNWKLVLKFVVAVSLMVGLGTCLFTCFEFYLGFPTYTDISMVNQNESLFAAVTFCPEPDSKSKAKLAVLKVSKIINSSWISLNTYIFNNPNHLQLLKNHILKSRPME